MPKLIGSLGEAEVASTLDSYTWNHQGGWVKVGVGCSRHAYRSPTGVIYKVAYHNEDNVNEHETTSIMRRRKMPEGWAVPQTALYKTKNGKVILAMQDCGTEMVELTDAEKDMVRKKFGVYDPHGDNIRYFRGTYYCIDFGFSNLPEARRERAEKRKAAQTVVPV
jgi:hypothetical protein